MYGIMSDAGMGPCPPRVAAGSTNPRLGFHNVRGGIGPGDHRFLPRFAGVGVWKDL